MCLIQGIAALWTIDDDQRNAFFVHTEIDGQMCLPLSRQNARLVAAFDCLSLLTLTRIVNKIVSVNGLTIKNN
jgi:hypothetical protein